MTRATAELHSASVSLVLKKKENSAAEQPKTVEKLAKAKIMELMEKTKLDMLLILNFNFL